LRALTDRTGTGPVSQAGLPAVVVPGPRAVLGALAARLYGDPASALTVIGVTGTHGKTTTTALMESGAEAAPAGRPRGSGRTARSSGARLSRAG
jgi:UDP-N-acetylmuramoyl-L-alanyl-D-glutamate--2,6-diaminopimelate ligase